MKAFSSEEFGRFIIEAKIVGFFDKPVTLKSGRISHWYVNWRPVTSDVALLDTLTDFILSFVAHKKIGLDCFYGVPEGATKTAVITQFKWAKNQPGFEVGSHYLPMGRAKPKLHGNPDDKFFVGAPKGRTLVLEDVTTTGGSLIETVDQLKASQVNVVGMIGLTNRMEQPVDRSEGSSVEERLKKRYPGVPYWHMSSAEELLPLAVQLLKPAKEIVSALEAEYQEYGVKPLRF